MDYSLDLQAALSQLSPWLQDASSRALLVRPLGALGALVVVSLLIRWTLLSPLARRLAAYAPDWAAAIAQRRLLHNLAALVPLIGIYLLWDTFGLPDNLRRATLVAIELVATLSLARLPWMLAELLPAQTLAHSALRGSRDDALALAIWGIGAVFMLGTVVGAEVFLAYTAWFLKGLLAVAVAALAYLIARHVVRKPLSELIRTTDSRWDDAVLDRGVFAALSWIVPVVALYALAELFGGAAGGLRRVMSTIGVMLVALVFTRLLGAGYDIYTASARDKKLPIKGYLELASLIIWVVGGLLAFGTLLNQSPWALLSGIGAMTAVLMLVFRDTILSFVASIQIASNQMIQVGDWVSFPKYNADGDVIDIALHVVKIQNFDKTITTIPTHRFISDSFQNWRGMADSGGRRIKRALRLDMNTVRFLTEAEIERLQRLTLLSDYLKDKQHAITEHNAQTPGVEQDPLNGRQLTNLGTFRAYALAYIQALPEANPDMTLLVRQLAPEAHGLGIELYLFSKEKRWARYESLQADIFDHLIAILPVFGLAVFQAPSGRDLAELGGLPTPITPPAPPASPAPPSTAPAA